MAHELKAFNLIMILTIMTTIVIVIIIIMILSCASLLHSETSLKHWSHWKLFKEKHSAREWENCDFPNPRPHKLRIVIVCLCILECPWNTVLTESWSKKKTTRDRELRHFSLHEVMDCELQFYISLTFWNLFQTRCIESFSKKQTKQLSDQGLTSCMC